MEISNNMNNKTKTSVVLTTTTIVLLTVMFVPNHAFADGTPWYGGIALTNGDAGFWFQCSSLNSMDVDGDTTNNCNKVKSAVQDSMSTYNGLGNDIDLTTTSSFTDYLVYATNLGLFGPSAEATFPSSTGDYLRFNDHRALGTSGGCQNFLGFNYAYNIEWLTNHEFGHTTGLAHHTTGHNSVMVEHCANSWSNVQSDDEFVLDNKYQ